MIEQTVHFPPIYDSQQSGGGIDTYYLDAILGILLDVQRNCVLLVDQDWHIFHEIESAIGTWPNVHNQKARQILKALKKQQRFVPIPGPISHEGCHQLSCRLASAIASQASLEPLIAIVPEKNPCGSSCIIGACEIVPVNQYATSEFSVRRRSSEALTIPAGTTREEFERIVLRPLFRHTKRVKVFDRWVGRKQMENLGSSRANPFLDNLAWMYGVFMNCALNRKDLLFEVTTGIVIDQNSGALGFFPKAARELEHFPDGQTKRFEDFSSKFEMHVKQESLDRQLDHDRYLITDQIALMFSSGFHLFNHSNRVSKKFTISRCPENPGDVEASYRIFPDLRSRERTSVLGGKR